MFQKGRVMKPVAKGLLLLGVSLGFTAVQAADEVTEPDTDYSYVVSVQDTQGTKLCNGVYIGGNQIMLYSQCKTPISPWPTLPGGGIELPDSGGEVVISPAPVDPVPLQVNPLSLNPMLPVEAESLLSDQIDYSDDEYPPFLFALPGTPGQVVFTDKNGIESEPVRIKRLVNNPYTGSQSIAAVRSVPDGIRALPLASLEQIESLESTDAYPVHVVGRTAEGRLNIEARDLISFDNCQSSWPSPIPLPSEEQDPLNRQICLSVDIQSCMITRQDSTLYGAPIVARLSSGEEIVIGNAGSDCQKHDSASDHQRWASLMDMKAKGLQVAMAYDLGERDKLERPKLDIQFNNESADQKFDLLDLGLFNGDNFQLLANSCDVLEPGDSCGVVLGVDVSDSVSINDLLTLNVNGEDVGIYTAVQGVAHRFIKGDREALWKMNGWKKKGFFNSGIYTATDISTSPSITRTRHVVNPGSINVTYKLEGDSLYGATITLRRQEMRATQTFMNFLGMTLPGTNGEWTTKTIDIPVPGAYSIQIGRMIYPIDERDEFDMEIESICFGNDCQ